MIRLRLVIAAVLILFSVVQHAQSAIINGRFETGDFSGWTLGGHFLANPRPDAAYHTITGTGFGLGPIQGTFSALLVARSVATTSCNDPINGWAFGCPLPPGVAGLPIAPLGGLALAYPPGPTDLVGPDLSGGSYVDSWIGQDFQGLTGDEIDVSIQKMTNEASLGFFPDSFEVLATQCPNLSCQSDPNRYVYAYSFSCPQTDPNTASTGFLLATTACDVRLTLPADGLWTLYIGVVQGLDPLYATGILVDNVRQLREVAPVPSPGTLPLLLLGIGLAALARSRQRKRA